MGTGKTLDEMTRDSEEKGTLHPDNLPGNVADRLYGEQDVNLPLEHEAAIDTVYRKNQVDYDK